MGRVLSLIQGQSYAWQRASAIALCWEMWDLRLPEVDVGDPETSDLASPQASVCHHQDLEPVPSGRRRVDERLHLAGREWSLLRPRP